METLAGSNDYSNSVTSSRSSEQFSNRRTMRPVLSQLLVTPQLFYEALYFTEEKYSTNRKNHYAAHWQNGRKMCKK